MNSKKLYFTLIATIVVLVGLILAGVYLGNQMLKTASDELYDLKAESVALSQQQNTLVQAKKDVEKYRDVESIARTVVPQEKDQARTVREIVSIADRTGITIANVSFPSSTLGTTDKKKKAASGGVTQLEPVEGITGVSQMEINVQTDSADYVPFVTLLGFLKSLEQNRRTAQVKSLTVTPSAEDRDLVTFNVILNVYIQQGAQK